VSICFTQTPPTHFIKIKWAKDLSFCHTKRRKKRDDFLLPKSSLFFLKPWMNEQKISRILFVHPLKICEQYGFIQSCSYKSKASHRPCVCGKINVHTIAAQKYTTPQAA
jgi:hypothetical protein